MVEVAGNNSFKTVGDYRVVRTIGRGMNSVVKEVTKDDVAYAMKIMRLDDIRTDEKVLEIMQKEAEILQQQNIPGLPAIHDFSLDA